MLTHHLTVTITEPKIVASESARIEALSTIGGTIADRSTQHNAMRAVHRGESFTVTTAATVSDAVSFSELKTAILEALGLNPRRASVELICTNSH